MRYDTTVKQAISAACDRLTKAEFCRRVGFDPAMISAIVRGRARGCKDDRWEKLWLVLSEHGGLDRGDMAYWPRSRLIAERESRQARDSELKAHERERDADTDKAAELPPAVVDLDQVTASQRVVITDILSLDDATVEAVGSVIAAMKRGAATDRRRGPGQGRAGR